MYSVSINCERLTEKQRKKLFEPFEILKEISKQGKKWKYKQRDFFGVPYVECTTRIKYKNNVVPVTVELYKDAERIQICIELSEHAEIVFLPYAKEYNHFTAAHSVTVYNISVVDAERVKNYLRFYSLEFKEQLKQIKNIVPLHEVQKALLQPGRLTTQAENPYAVIWCDNFPYNINITKIYIDKVCEGYYITLGSDEINAVYFIDTVNQLYTDDGETVKTMSESTAIYINNLIKQKRD